MWVVNEAKRSFRGLAVHANTKKICESSYKLTLWKIAVIFTLVTRYTCVCQQDNTVSTYHKDTIFRCGSFKGTLSPQPLNPDNPKNICVNG